MKQDNMLAMILAGGRGTRLHDLTKKVAKPAVSYGGKYRIIDFPLSNCANSGIDIVGVLTQYESVLLNSYAAAGRRWGLDAKDSGVYILPPREKADTGLDVYRGTADAISQNIDFIDSYSPEYLLILSGDHIYKMNYDKMLEYHKANHADATIAVIEVPMKEASRFGIMNAIGAFYNFIEDESVRLIGCEAAACNALDYVSRQPGRTRDCMIPDEQYGKYIYGIRDTIRTKSMMNMDLIFDRFPNELIPFDFDTYFSSPMNCELVTTNCLTGKAEYMSEEEDRDRLMKICRASSSMPLLTPIVNIEDVPYLDGGLADSVPIRRAKEIGNEKIVVVLTKNAGYRKKVLSPAMQKLYRKAYSSYPNVVRTILRRSFMYNKTMNYLDVLERKGEIFVIRPHVKPVSRLERNREALYAFYEHGYHYMERQLEALEEYLEK